MISGLLAKPRQRFKTLSKNRCLPTVPTEALRRLWVDSGSFAATAANGEVAPDCSRWGNDDDALTGVLDGDGT